MDIRIIAEQLGIKKYPSDFVDFCKNATPVSICDKKKIEELEEKYSFLGEYAAPLYECLELIKSNESMCIYGGYAVAYLQEKDIKSGRQITVPIPDEDTVMRFYPLLVLCAALPSGIKKYRDRGFSEEEIYNAISPTFKARIALSYSDTKKQGLDAPGFSWLKLYAIAGVFPSGVFNITPKYFDSENVILKNKITGEIIPLLSGIFHRSGMVLGSEGFEDESDSFMTDFNEDKEYFYGYPAINSLASRNRQKYNKNEWEILLKNGDGFAGVHIPKGADLSPEKMKEGFRLALELTKKCYPEYNAKAVCCTSWMLDPKLQELLGEKSKISCFIDQYVKYPVKSGGQNIFGFVFPRTYKNYVDLPEDTSLRRKLKSLYLNGEFIHSFSGIVKE